MDEKLNKLALQIMAECEADGEPVTKEEATEMARMELGEKQIKRYEQADKPRKKRTPPKRKVDENKKHLLMCIKNLLDGMHASITTVKNEAEVSFTYKNENYTVKLIKHRK